MAALPNPIEALVSGLVADLTALFRAAQIDTLKRVLNPDLVREALAQRSLREDSPTHAAWLETKEKQPGTFVPPKRVKKIKRRSPLLLSKHRALVLAYVKKNPGVGGGKIRDALKLSDVEWRLTSQALKADKLIHAKGNRTQAVWHAVKK